MNPGPEPQVYESLNCMEIWGGIEPVEIVRTTPGLDIWVYSRPYEGAGEGGDLHYVTLCGGGQVTRIIVADVSGHGVAVAEFASMLRGLLRKHINKKSQRRLVGWLNRRFGEEARLGLFATAIVATYLTSNDQLSVCNAGHPRPLLYRAEEGRWSILHGEEPTRRGAVNLPLGLDERTHYDQFTVTLGRDDLVVFYTDALTEAVDDQAQLLGEAGFLEIAGRIDRTDLAPRAVGAKLRDAVAEFRGHRPPDDDLTLIVLRHTAAPSPRLSISQKLDVYAKVFGLKPV
jgi:sigma-B regulation protein RsbU (phosphoserine phosphatase)